ncbi:MAG: hypothetical protein ACYC41_13455 [Bacillota bacterium]
MPHGKKFEIPLREARPSEPSPQVCKLPTTDAERKGFCPECHAQGRAVKMVPTSGCEVCPVCGYSPCS